MFNLYYILNILYTYTFNKKIIKNISTCIITGGHLANYPRTYNKENGDKWQTSQFYRGQMANLYI